MSSYVSPTQGPPPLALKSVEHAPLPDLDVVSYTFRNRDQIHGDQPVSLPSIILVDLIRFGEGDRVSNCGSTDLHRC